MLTSRQEAKKNLDFIVDRELLFNELLHSSFQAFQAFQPLHRRTDNLTNYQTHAR